MEGTTFTGVRRNGLKRTTVIVGHDAVLLKTDDRWWDGDTVHNLLAGVLLMPVVLMAGPLAVGLTPADLFGAAWPVAAAVAVGCCGLLWMLYRDPIRSIAHVLGLVVAAPVLVLFAGGRAAIVRAWRRYSMAPWLIPATDIAAIEAPMTYWTTVHIIRHTGRHQRLRLRGPRAVELVDAIRRVAR